MEWLSVHLFYYSDIERLLVSWVEPLVEDLRGRGLVDRFFFVRYMEGGPHVRLRFRGDPQEVRPAVERTLRSFVATCPSDVTLSEDQLKQLGVDWTEHADEQPLAPQPNNSLLYLPYEPEIERYGGPAGVAIAEEHFDFSTRQALELLRRFPAESSRGWLQVNSRRRLGTALQVMFVFSAALGFSLSQTRRIFELYHRQVLSYAPATPESLESRFASQAEGLCRTARRLREGTLEDSPFLAGWAAHGRELGPRLLTVDLPGSPESRTSRYARIMTSYLHMFNNRLGIFFPDELYLTYLIQRTCEMLGAERPAEPAAR